MLLKDNYSAEYAQRLAARIAEACPELDREGFAACASAGLEGRRYSERLDAFVRAFELYLPPYAETLGIFGRILGPELSSFAVMYSEGAWLAPVGRYVETLCAGEPDSYEQSVSFIRELTRRYTGEFAMRPLIAAFPERTMAVLLGWSLDKSAYVRRCASECMRVSLPWAKHLTAAVEHFDAYSAVLDNLRRDEDPYVRRSVGNNLNDLYKYDAQKAQSIVDRWQAEGPAKETREIILRGTRTLRRRQRSSAGH